MSRRRRALTDPISNRSLGLDGDRLYKPLHDKLNAQEAGVVYLRFGLSEKEPQTLDEIGKLYGVTRERIRQILERASTSSSSSGSTGSPSGTGASMRSGAPTSSRAATAASRSSHLCAAGGRVSTAPTSAVKPPTALGAPSSPSLDREVHLEDNRTGAETSARTDSGPGPPMVSGDGADLHVCTAMPAEESSRHFR